MTGTSNGATPSNVIPKLNLGTSVVEATGNGTIQQNGDSRTRPPFNKATALSSQTARGPSASTTPQLTGPTIQSARAEVASAAVSHNRLDPVGAKGNARPDEPEFRTNYIAKYRAAAAALSTNNNTSTNSVAQPAPQAPSERPRSSSATVRRGRTVTTGGSGPDAAVAMSVPGSQMQSATNATGTAGSTSGPSAAAQSGNSATITGSAAVAQLVDAGSARPFTPAGLSARQAGPPAGVRSGQPTVQASLNTVTGQYRAGAEPVRLAATTTQASQNLNNVRDLDQVNSNRLAAPARPVNIRPVLTYQ